MTDILNLQVKDTALTDVISNNPYYINIKGSVNICLIRCGQEIESCNDVYFSTMTNYGKILVLSPNTNKTTTCNIKLAYDTSNDNINNNGTGSYLFERAFFTVPSLHQLNGQIFDMETFLVFSSVQKNGNILYTCLCTFSNGITNIPQSNDPKLLNYKLMNELFVKNNTIPDVYGTSSISGIPNPVDLSAFIPQEGSRSFYDYTHPQNTKVNFRIFQTPMSVPTEVITMLKSKLTPGNIYTNFKNAISKSINPLEGLFFYYSEDLTNIYKSYKVNDTTIENNSVNTSSESILDEQENFEKDNLYKKLETAKIDEEESKLENKLNEDKTEDTFSNDNRNTNLSITYIIFIFAIILIGNYAGMHIITNIFTSQENLNADNIKKSINNINDDMNIVLGSKFKIYSNFIFQCIFSLIIILILVFSIISNNNNENINNGMIVTFSFFILINGIFSIILNLRYIFNRLRAVYDNDFTQRENYLTNYIFKDIYKSKNIYDISKKFWNIFIMERFQNIEHNNSVSQTGGDIHHVPGPVENHSNMDAANFKLEFDNNSNNGIFNFIMIYKILTSNFFRTKLSENPKWGKNVTVYLFFIIIFYIIMLIIISYYLSSNYQNIGVNIIIRFISFIFVYIPIIILPNILNSYYGYESNTFNKIIRYIILGLSIIGFIFYFVSIFIPNYVSGIFIYISSGIVTFSYIILLILYFLRAKLESYIKKYGAAISKGSPESINSTIIPDPTLDSSVKLTSGSTDILTDPTNILKLIEDKNLLEEKTRLLEEELNNIKSTISGPSLMSDLQLRQNLQNEKDKTNLLKAELDRLKSDPSKDMQKSPSIENYIKLKENLEKEKNKTALLSSDKDKYQSILDNQIDQLTAEINSLKLQQENLESDKGNLNNERNNKLNRTEEINKELNNKFTSNEQEINRLKSELNNLLTEINRLNLEIEKLNSEIENNQQTIQQLQEEIRLLKEKGNSYTPNEMNPNLGYSNNNNNQYIVGNHPNNHIIKREDDIILKKPVSNLTSEINKLTELAKKNRQNLKYKYLGMINDILSTIVNISDLNNDIRNKRKIIAIIDKLLSKEAIDYINIRRDISQLDNNHNDKKLINNLKDILNNIKIKLTQFDNSDSDSSVASMR